MHCILICLLVVPSVLFAGENLSLACKGILLNQFQLENDGDFHVVESPDYLESFVFINGVLQRRIGNL